MSSRRDLFRQITNPLREPLLLVTGEGAILAANTAARELFREDNLDQLTLAEVAADPQYRIAEALKRWSSSRQMMPAALQIRSHHASMTVRVDGALVQSAANGTPALLLLQCMPRRETATTTLFMRLGEQVAALRKHIAEQKRREQETLEDMQTAAAIFAHEISNPLNFISTSLQLLEIELAQKNIVESTITSTVEAASREIQRLGSLLTEFRSFAQPQVLDLEPGDLMAIIEDVLAPELLAFRAKGVEVKLDFPILPPVLVDPDRMKQVILNLCKNAVEAMPDGGVLKIRGRLGQGFVTVEFIDTGVGIPAGLQVFDLFRTTKPHGSGLGLSIVRQIISAHKGTIDYHSNPGAGTTFVITIPTP